MFLAAMIVRVLMTVAMAEDPPITVKGYPWAPFISPMGEPFRPTGEAPIARWFGQVDRNRDGMITPDEMQADADRFFGRLDSDRDGQIDPEEMVAYEWEIAPEIQVNSQWRRTRGQAAAQAAANSRTDADRDRGDGSRKIGDEHDGYRIGALQGAARYALLNIPQPVASADADLNRLVTQAEFRQAASYRFKLLDSDGLGRLTLQQLDARLPTRPEGRRARRGKEPKDSRIGLPVPKGD